MNVPLPSFIPFPVCRRKFDDDDPEESQIENDLFLLLPPCFSSATALSYEMMQ